MISLIDFVLKLPEFSEMPKEAKKFINTPIGITHLINFIYAIGMTSMTTLVPFLVADVGGSVLDNGFLQALFAILQFGGALIFGKLGDILGPKNAFYLAQYSSAATLALLSIGITLPLLYFAQLPALFMHGFQAASLLVCHITKPDERTPNIAFLALSYGAGMIFGGLLCAFLGLMGLGPRIIILISAFICLWGGRQAKRFDDFQELLPKKVEEHLDAYLEMVTYELASMARVFQKVVPWALLLLISLIPGQTARHAFTPAAIHEFQLSTFESGSLVAYAGVIAVISEGILTPYLSSRFGDKKSIKYAIYISLIGFSAMIFTGSNLFFICIGLFPIITSAAVIYICITSQMTKLVNANEFGTVLGLNGAIFYFVTSFAPVTGLAFYALSGLPGLWLFCFICITFLLFYTTYVDIKILVSE